MKYYPNRFNLFNDHFFDDLFPMQNDKAMACDIKETETGYQLALNVPGFSKEDLKMSLENGYLTIEASHSSSDEKTEENGRWIRQERYSGSYQRSFYVGEQVTENDIRASYNNGVLEIDVPKISKKAVENKKIIPIE